VMLRRKILGAPSCSRNAIANSLITLDPSSSCCFLPACPFSHSPHHHALHLLELSHKHKHSVSPLLPPQTIHTHHLIPSKQQLSISVSGVFVSVSGHSCTDAIKFLHLNTHFFFFFLFFSSSSRVSHFFFSSTACCLFWVYAFLLPFFELFFPTSYTHTHRPSVLVFSQFRAQLVLVFRISHSISLTTLNPLKNSCAQVANSENTSAQISLSLSLSLSLSHTHTPHQDPRHPPHFFFLPVPLSPPPTISFTFLPSFTFLLPSHFPQVQPSTTPKFYPNITPKNLPYPVEVFFLL
jgi:hypothetical protein